MKVARMVWTYTKSFWIVRDEESETKIIFEDNFNDGGFEGWTIENGNGGATWILVSNRNGGSIERPLKKFII